MRINYLSDQGQGRITFVTELEQEQTKPLLSFAHSAMSQREQKRMRRQTIRWPSRESLDGLCRLRRPIFLALVSFANLFPLEFSGHWKSVGSLSRIKSARARPSGIGMQCDRIGFLHFVLFRRQPASNINEDYRAREEIVLISIDLYLWDL